MEIHKKCGGVVENRRCSRCGKVWGKVKYIFATDIEIRRKQFNPEEHRKRIREMRDILK